MKGGIVSPFFPPFPELRKEREREGMAAVSSSMMFYAGMEKERGRGEGGKKGKGCWGFICIVYVLVCSL